MQVGYTEFSFGYAFTENLMRASPIPPLSAPIFPNLIQEGQLGWDLNIQFPTQPLFFQFKLPGIMRRQTKYAKEVKKCADIDVPFFRFDLMRRNASNQHALLMQLEDTQPKCVFYAAPCLATTSEFDEAYKNALVAHRSALISPKEIGALPDNKLHRVSYREDGDYGCFRSEPRKITILSYAQLVDSIVANLSVNPSPLAISARQLRASVMGVCSSALRQAEQAIHQRVLNRVSRPDVTDTKIEALTDILVAREIARVDLGLEVIIAQLPIPSPR